MLLEHPATNLAIIQIDIVHVAVGPHLHVNDNLSSASKCLNVADGAVVIETNISHDALPKIVEEQIALVLSRISVARVYIAKKLKK